ncbi:MAG: DUF4276 family protein [Candidatus Polarisedimenticolaceae bacterium]|nr:DUF4276 family protein [Candidatus Polarisedimenticolaceae bacterium]
MVTVGFVVEGPSDKRLVENDLFRGWLREGCNLELVGPIVDAGGNGQMCSHNIVILVEKLRIQATPDKVVVLADLDPDSCAPCVEKRKEIIGSAGIDLVVIARKAMESWFLADTEAMRCWTEDNTFHEEYPESLAGMPWDRLKEIGRLTGRGPGASKKIFARKFIRDCGFDVRRAAVHPNCPSARYFVNRLSALGAS